MSLLLTNIGELTTHTEEHDTLHDAAVVIEEGRIAWIAIPEVLKAVLDRHDGGPATGVEDVVDADRRGRAHARARIEQTGRTAR